MKAKDKFINRIIDGFQHKKGKASFYCFYNDIIPEIVYNVIYKFINKRPKATIFIAVDCYNTRSKIINYLKKYFDENIIEQIKCISVDYIKQHYTYINTFNIIVGINDSFNIINKLNTESNFTLCILTKNIMDNEFITNIRNILPCIDTADLDIAVKKDNVYSPVEEHRYGVDLSDADKKLYNEYTNYINTSISIFGNLNNIERCKTGDSELNISAMEVRYAIATTNGWKEDLDTSIDFMRQLDEIYNPNALLERACNFYNISKLRRDLVCNNDAKLEIIGNICLDNQDKQILIISKNGDYAANITKYLNECLDLKCGDYHDCIEDKIAIDDNTKEPILIKSGANKGQPKILKAQAQSSLNEQRFNDKTINILSIKSASNTKLKIACDIVIFTSSLCDGIIEVKNRFTNIVFNGVPTKTYKIYCNNTIENNNLNKEKDNHLFTIINETENIVLYDENSDSIIL